MAPSTPIWARLRLETAAHPMALSGMAGCVFGVKARSSSREVRSPKKSRRALLGDLEGGTQKDNHHLRGSRTNKPGKQCAVSLWFQHCPTRYALYLSVPAATLAKLENVITTITITPKTMHAHSDTLASGIDIIYLRTQHKHHNMRKQNNITHILASQNKRSTSIMLEFGNACEPCSQHLPQWEPGFINPWLMKGVVPVYWGVLTFGGNTPLSIYIYI